MLSLASFRGARAGSDILLVVLVAGLVLWEILPELLEGQALWTLPFLALGLAGPYFVERLFLTHAASAHSISIVLALVGLSFHGLVDGTALRLFGAEAAQSLSALPLAIILHRLPVGLTIWLFLRRRSNWAAPALLFLLALATILGFALGSELVGSSDLHSMAWFEALVAGSLLHVVMHRRHESREHSH